MKKKEDSRKFTLIIAPHSERPIFSLTISFFWFKAAAVVLVLFMTSLFGFAYSNITLKDQLKENLYLKETNRVQREFIEEITMETQKLMDQIAEIEILSENIADFLELVHKE